MRATPWRLLAGFCFAVAGVGRGQETLPPAEPLLPESALPAYERELDHAAFIRGWNKASLQRGEKIYQLVCHACHGDLNLPGSLPQALRFGEGRFQHGNDPLTMYQTITRGWRQMPPQVQLVPQEKYDVIHYIRETFLARTNAAQLFAVTPAYLAGLPQGTQRGPVPIKREPWREMDYGNFLIGTFEVADAANRVAAAARKSDQLDEVPAGANLAYKGIAVRLDAGAGGVAAGRAWVVFEHDTARIAGGWTGEGFVDWEGINFNGRHVVRPRTIGEPQFETADGPGWANPATGTFDDARVIGVDGRRFGPLPRAWILFRGVYRAADRVIVSYRVGEADVLESCALETRGTAPIFVRTLNIGRSPRDLILRVANHGTAVAVSGLPRAALREDERFITLRVPATATPARIALRMAKPGTSGLDIISRDAPAPRDLTEFTHGSPAQWTAAIETPVVGSDGQGAFAWERFTLPQANPWKCRVRPSGLDFLPGGKDAVVCTWDGDVWRVSGIHGQPATVTWRRMASGLFQPLGIKVVRGEIFVTCRDQLVILRDLNGDGETDFYECFNSDHQVTEHFHEFAMGLQVDDAGNFYYAKSARHARTALVPQHGTLLKIRADGAATEILANGFRAANGVCLNPDGSFFVTDQEGHWMPMNRINRVTPGKFFGNMWSYGAPPDAADSAMAPPVCWIDKAFDRSPGELLRVESAAWGALNGQVLNLSYGQGRIEVMISEVNGGREQGAVCALPLPDFPTGIMRGRFHPQNGQLYLCGLSAWATSQTLQEGGFYRLRATGRPATLPTAWHVTANGIELTFSSALDAAVTDAARFTVKTWGLRRTANYGSPRLDERSLVVSAVDRSSDARTVRLALTGMAPADVIEISCRLKTAEGEELERVITGTVHYLPGRTTAAAR